MRKFIRAAAGMACAAFAASTAVAQGDDCTTATAITDPGIHGIVSTAPFSTAGFTIAGPVVACNGAADPVDGYWLYTAAISGQATFSVCPFSSKAPGGSVVDAVTLANGDTTLAAFDNGGPTPACPITSAAIVCQDGAPDCPGAIQSEITFNVVAGNTYYINLGDWNNGVNGFTGTLAWVVNPIPSGPPPVPPLVGLDQTLPPGFDNANTGFISNNPFGITYAAQAPAIAGMIHQYCYDTSFFEYRGIQRINSIAFRQHPAAAAVGGTTNNVSIYMTSSPLDMNLLSNTFAANRGPDYTLVWTGSITWPAGTPTGTGNWITIPLTTTFDYDPVLGKDFLVEVVTADLATANASPIEVGFGPPRTQANTTSATALTANQGLVTAALFRIDYTPLPYLRVSSTGGDLSMSLSEIPGSMAQGWTVISTNTSNPVDSGPILGIYPTQTTFDVLSLNPSLGNPLAFTTGAPTGLYPTSPFLLGPGSVSFLAGQTWDFVTLGVDPFLFFVRRSNVARVTF
jgi:hypothetical protein